MTRGVCLRQLEPAPSRAESRVGSGPQLGSYTIVSADRGYPEGGVRMESIQDMYRDLAGKGRFADNG